MTFSWNELPSALEYRLRVGTVGKMHLTGLARLAFGERALAPLGADMLLAAWEADPLDATQAGQLAKFMPADDPSGLRNLFLALSELWTVDEYVVRLQQRQKAEQLFQVLEDKLRGPERTLFHLHKAVELGLSLHEPAWALEFLALPWPEEIAPAVAWTRAMVELLDGNVEQARNLLMGLRGSLPLPGVLTLLGECELRLGNRSAALGLWREALAARPWDVSLMLRAHDIARGVDQLVRPLEGEVNLFLYTYNKAEELESALAALAEAGLGNVRTTVLDNGCTDDTRAVLAKWSAALGDRSFNTITLPVNIGAPAARNWLLHLPETKAAPWTIYLDDDAVVPGDWLGRLGAAVETYPDAGVWGCKVLDAGLPHVIQNADLHPRPDYAEPGVFESGEMSDLHHQGYDTGGFSFLRPCTSVTGCCHLFRTETLLECGDFDLAFSPSQFDDLDHDLRLALDGKMAVYQGHLPVLHMKRSGKLTQQTGMGLISGRANHAKLKAKHSGPAWEDIRNAALKAMREDQSRKSAALGSL